MSRQMSGLTESFFASKSFTYAAAAIAFLAAAALLSLIFRLTFGRKLRLPRNGRARTPRLGTVDAFDLDRQRQLVIIRRDNVEHLLMIGGPNDIVIESEIIRAESREPRDLREARIRGKERREREPRDASSAPAGISFPSPAEAQPPNTPPRQMPFPPAGLERETWLAAAVPIEESARDSAPPIVLPAPRRPVFPLPPRRMPAPVTPFGQGTSNQREPLHGGSGPPQKPELGINPAKGVPRPPIAAPSLRAPVLRRVQGTAADPAPSGTSETLFADEHAGSALPGFEEIQTSPAGEVAGQTEFLPAPATQSAGSVTLSVAASRLILEVPAAGPADGAVTLEEEMARLLGRAHG
jgi:flagellar protein FliO/FliZ